MIVDTHVHVIAADQSRYPLRPSGHGGPWFLEHPVTVEQFATDMAGAGVERAVLVQAMGAYSTDNRYVVDAALTFPDRFVSVVIVDTSEPDAALQLRTVARSGPVRGVRLFAINAPLDDDATIPVCETAGELGLRVVVATLADQLPALGRLLARIPDVAVALDHCGFADLTHDGRDLFQLAERPNLHLKVSSIVLEAAADPADAVARLVATFGADRVMWGSDYPQTHDRSYAELVALAQRGCAALTQPERDLVLGGTALRLWPDLA